MSVVVENDPAPSAVKNPLPVGVSVIGNGVAVPIVSLLVFSISPSGGLATTNGQVNTATAALFVSCRPVVVSKRYLPGCRGALLNVKPTVLPPVVAGVSV